MTTSYEAPRLIKHGTLAEITAASLDSDRQDRIFNAEGVQTGSDTGSLDQCFFNPSTYTCIIKE